MALRKRFENALEDLWSFQRDKIVHLAVGRPRGRPKKYDKRIRDKKLDEVKRLAEELILKDKKLRKRFHNMCSSRWMLLGGRVNGKIDKACDVIEQEGWVEYVYCFWRDRNCVYVGRTTWGKNRLRQPDERRYFRQSTRLVLLEPYHLSNLDRLECLAIHYYKPKANRMRASRKKYANKCPVCARLKRVEKEAYRPFRLK